MSRGGGQGQGNGKGRGKGKSKGKGNGNGSGGETVRTYVYGNYIDEPITMTASESGRGGTYYYHTNNMFNVRALTDSSGDVVERYRYTAYGEPTIYDDQGGEISHSAVGNAYMFQGRRHDPETGLYYYRNRYYSATLGRFVTRDPMGYVDGYCLYVGFTQSPLETRDPLGLKGEDGSIPEHIQKDMDEIGNWIKTAGSLDAALKKAMSAGNKKMIQKWLETQKWISTNLKFPDTRAPSKWQYMTKRHVKTYMSVAAKQKNVRQWMQIAGNYSPALTIIANSIVKGLTESLGAFAKSRHCMSLYEQGIKMAVACDPNTGSKKACCRIKAHIGTLSKKCKFEIKTGMSAAGAGIYALYADMMVDKLEDEMVNYCEEAIKRISDK